MNSSLPEDTVNHSGVLSRLPLRMRLSLVFVTGSVAILILIFMNYAAVDFNARQSQELQAAGAQLEFVNELAHGATEIQLAATRYVYLGHDSARQQVSSTLGDWMSKVSACREQRCLRPEQADAIQVHLQAFLDAFTLVERSRSGVKDALAQDFSGIRASAIALTEEDLPPLYLHSINDHISTIEATLRAYMATSDPQRILDAQAHLEELQRHLISRLGDINADLPAEAPLFSVSLVEDTVYENIQRIRSYAYLVNVVMPSEARELEYLANSAAEKVREEIVSLTSEMERNRRQFYLWDFSIILLVVLTSVPIFFWLLNSLTKPIRQLSEQFRRLSTGSEEVIVGAAKTNDEIGDLFKAAEAFRQENIRERQLLADYRELSRSLEAQVAERTRELKTKNAELDHLASVDKLTDIFNRRALDAALSTELARAKRYQRSLSLLLMDIDLFKQVNDHYGHLTGDKVLVTLTKEIQQKLRGSDILGRWGGEEFLIVCPETSLEQARNIAEKIRSSIEQTDFRPASKITISIGISVLGDNDTAEALVARADRALYMAKSQGRNCVRVYSDLSAAPSENTAQKLS
ncbi:GGDEF domain-containing protein [Congregibacter litoralis]|uniref:diguanylate cyclase n=1 Tax=Congregibacter litoralis KT71 TaxID=314285 RepID=A4ABQ6_9GAMM|nr:GGDEF domain-containing protein [Congregibacter litoralis]EAQ96569.2 Response regulator [Congregibacter litoralis KT71]